VRGERGKEILGDASRLLPGLTPLMNTDTL